MCVLGTFCLVGNQIFNKAYAHQRAPAVQAHTPQCDLSVPPPLVLLAIPENVHPLAIARAQRGTGQVQLVRPRQGTPHTNVTKEWRERCKLFLDAVPPETVEILRQYRRPDA
jgi:hypothetical protein